MYEHNSSIDHSVFHQCTDRINIVLKNLDLLLHSEEVRIYNQAQEVAPKFSDSIAFDYCIANLARQALRILKSASYSLTGFFDDTDSVSHGVRILHRSIFDGVMRIEYLNSQNGSVDTVKNYIYSGILGSFRNNLSILIEIVENENLDFSEVNLSDGVWDYISNLKEDMSGDWFFKSLERYNADPSEFEEPILHYVKDSQQADFKKKFDDLKIQLDSLDKSEMEKFLRKNKSNFEYLNKKSRYIDDFWGADWWPKSKKLFKLFKSRIEQIYDPINLIRYFENLYKYNSAFVHPNVQASSEIFSEESPDYIVFYYQIVLADALIRVLKDQIFMTNSALNEMDYHMGEARKLGEIIRTYT